jgi:indole-3-pyruvate monooxygenase
LTNTLIIGAGPAGLAVGGRLSQAGLPFEIIESSDTVANAWHNHYRRLRLHTVKELSHLPGLPFPPEYPRYVPRAALVSYYESYARAFGIEPIYGVRARSIRRVGDGWAVETTTGTIEAGTVVVATGSNQAPVTPRIPGQDAFPKEIIHSRDYREPESFAGQTVLVVGMGNTGAEIALDLSEHGVDTTVSVRGPVNIVPRDVLGRPTQLTARLLWRLPERIGDRLGTLIRKLTVGDLSGYGIATPALPPLAQLREKGKTPVIDIGTVRRIKTGQIAVAPGVDHIEDDEVIFTDGTGRRFDTVILATGYRPMLEELLEDRSGLDDRGFPPGIIGTGPYLGLFFVGFDNHQPGGILGTIRDESKTVVDAIDHRPDQPPGQR